MKTKAEITVYVAEDHNAIRQMLIAHLKLRPGFSIVGQTADGLAAIEDCRRLKPQLLILDLDLRGVNGIEVSKAIKQDSPDTKVLVFSSHFDATTVRRAMEAGVKGMIEKTTALETLLEAIETVAAGHPFFGVEVLEVLQRAFVTPLATPSSDELTGREREVLQLVAEGATNKEVSSRLGISLRTAENHRHNLMRKLGARNGADLTREAFRLGLLKKPGLPADEL